MVIVNSLMVVGPGGGGGSHKDRLKEVGNLPGERSV